MKLLLNVAQLNSYLAKQAGMAASFAVEALTHTKSNVPKYCKESVASAAAAAAHKCNSRPNLVTSKASMCTEFAFREMRPNERA